MTSIELYTRFKKRVDKDTSGNITVQTFVDLFNDDQISYQLDAIGDQRQYHPQRGIAVRAPELTTRMMNMMAPFLTQPALVQLTDRIGTYNLGGYQAGNFAFGPYVWVSGYENPACGETALEAWELQVELLTQDEWRTRSDERRYNGASIKYPIFRLLTDVRIEVRPKAIKSVWVSYYRKPMPITIPTTIAANGVAYPDPSLPSQGPEWNELDCNAILDRVVGLSGLREQMDRWQAYGERSKQP
jgi:hypothetical protein